MLKKLTFVEVLGLLFVIFLMGCAPEFSPKNNTTNEKIIFLTDRDGKPAWNIMKPDGSDILPFVMSIPSEYKINGLQWVTSLDSYVLNLVDAQGNEDIFVLDSRKQKLQRVTSDGFPKSEIRYSNKLKKFVFTCFHNGFDICSVDFNGNNFKQLTNFITQEITPLWIKDEKIAFVSGYTGIPNIWIMDKNGDNLVNLSNIGYSEQNPDVSPDGDVIVFESQRDGNWNIFSYSSDADILINLTKSQSTNILPRWSPDGKWIAFMSDRNGLWEIFIIRPDGTDLRSMSANNSWRIQTFSWSQDSQSIYWVAEVNNFMQIFTSSVLNGDFLQITIGDYNNSSPIFVH